MPVNQLSLLSAQAQGLLRVKEMGFFLLYAVCSGCLASITEGFVSGLLQFLTCLHILIAVAAYGAALTWGRDQGYYYIHLEKE